MSNTSTFSGPPSTSSRGVPHGEDTSPNGQALRATRRLRSATHSM